MTPNSARPDERPTKIRTTQDGSGNEIIYEGFPEGNPTTDKPKWAIRRTVVYSDGSGTDTEEWANGNRNKTNVFDAREELKYKPIL